MLKPIYNKHYKKKNYFGEPYSGLAKFFKEYNRNSMILDLAYGQGRDALFLGKLGYRVKGIDISKVGINQMNKVAADGNLKVTGKIADVYLSNELHLNSKFHMYTVKKIGKNLIRVYWRNIFKIRNGGKSYEKWEYY